MSDGAKQLLRSKMNQKKEVALLVPLNMRQNTFEQAIRSCSDGGYNRCPSVGISQVMYLELLQKLLCRITACSPGT